MGKTHAMRKVPVSLRWTSSTFKGAGRHNTTTPFSNWPDDSCSLPRKTMKSLSRLLDVSLRSEERWPGVIPYRISKRVKAFFPLTELKGLKDGMAKRSDAGSECVDPRR